MIKDFYIEVSEHADGFKLLLNNRCGKIAEYPDTFNDLQDAIYAAIIWSRRYNIPYCFPG